jgi:L,D-peptidoglycan transpeptidase YkuD (ErfK/YbiS/YcfS/YnhG family)
MEVGGGCLGLFKVSRPAFAAPWYFWSDMKYCHPGYRFWAACAISAFALLAAGFSPASALAQTNGRSKANTNSSTSTQQTSPGAAAEQRLLEVYRLTAQGNTREALSKAQALANQHPNFRLAQLALADLLMARAPRKGGLREFAAAPAPMAQAAANAAAVAVSDSSLALQNPAITREDLPALKAQAQARVKANQNRPKNGSVPRELARLSNWSRYALAVDADLSRLYVFENTANGLTLVQDFYASVGKQGLDKVTEGDRRSPTGVYYLVAQYERKRLFDIYGHGALALNYPNEFDRRLGRTGSGIWLHGAPSDNFARVSMATDGCIALANPDLDWLLERVDLRRTPIVIAKRLDWVSPDEARRPHQDFEAALERWRLAKSSGAVANVSFFYTPDFNSFGKPLQQWMPELQAEMQRIGSRDLELKDLSYLYWRDPLTKNTEVMVVTFGQVAKGQVRGPTKRQYWLRQNGQWKIFFEGNIA